MAPHSDDETIGAWALMQRLKSRQAHVAVLVVTDGGASHPESQRWPRERVALERRRETVRAMRGLGIVPSAIRFLKLPDGALGSDPAALISTVARAIRRGGRRDLIVGPVARDDHPDHRAVACALRLMARFTGRHLGYQVWPLGKTSRKPRFYVPLDARALQSKRRAVRTYRTQTGIITDAQAGFTITARHMNIFVRPQERFAVLR